MADELHRFIYVSRTKLTASEDAGELAMIGSVSQANNLRWEVTGALLHGDGYFAQYIEGSRTHLADLIWRIRRDPRHYELNGAEDLHPRRIFRNWTFVYSGGASFISRTLEDLHGRALSQRVSKRIVWMLQQFEHVEVEPGERLTDKDD